MEVLTAPSNAATVLAKVCVIKRGSNIGAPNCQTSVERGGYDAVWGCLTKPWKNIIEELIVWRLYARSLLCVSIR